MPPLTAPPPPPPTAVPQYDIDFVCHDALPYVDVSGASATGDVYDHIKKVRV
jgi:hypothetical protein